MAQDGMTVEGLDELDEWFRTATPKLERQALRPGVRAGARVIVREAKRRVPVLTGGLKRAITVRAKTGAEERRKGLIVAVATVKRPEGSHGHLVEYGHDIVRGGRVVGHAAPHPFMRPARETTKNDVRGAVEQKVVQWVKKQKAKG